MALWAAAHRRRRGRSRHVARYRRARRGRKQAQGSDGRSDRSGIRHRPTQNGAANRGRWRRNDPKRAKNFQGGDMFVATTRTVVEMATNALQTWLVQFAEDEVRQQLGNGDVITRDRQFRAHRVRPRSGSVFAARAVVWVLHLTAVVNRSLNRRRSQTLARPRASGRARGASAI